MRVLRLLLAVVLGLAVSLPAEARPVRKRRAKRPARAAALPANVSLETRLATMAARPPVRQSEFAVAVKRLGDAEPLLLVNAQTPLVLASTAKLFTTAAALDRLGPGYRFRTRLYLDRDVPPDGVLSGPLVVAGGGDPAR